MDSIHLMVHIFIYYFVFVKPEKKKKTLVATKM